jgi:hypothetical protein
MKVRQVIKIIIEQMECPVHAARPTVDTTTNEITISACCKAFQTVCTEHVSSILSGIDVSDYWKVA